VASYILGIALLAILAFSLIGVGMMAVAFASIFHRGGWKAIIDDANWTPLERILMKVGAGMGVLTCILYFAFFAAAEHLLGTPNPLW
jgi:hypothetical protein